MAGATIMTITYGITVQPKGDPHIARAAQSNRPLFLASIPGTFLVDLFPILKYVPEWMPFAGFKVKARLWRKLALDMINLPYDAGKQNMASICTLTTVSATASCILGFLANPAALRKAQEEIDRVVGWSRLPTFEDEDSLPYITAITKEALRWQNVTPIAVPHLLHADDEYNGYRLPKGSIVIPNAWAMLHDEKVYPNPFNFNPDRFMKDGKLDPNARDPMHAAFGFGRRICPARYMAFSAVWIAIASIVATFEIAKARDANGEVIEPSYEYISALV
ncbi:hypothetical protein H0H87_004685, partial [Tephrocybe sp. NHM501043]